MGGKLVIGVLKGYDQLMNLVLDDTVEYMSNPDDENNTELISKNARKLGLNRHKRYYFGLFKFRRRF